MTTTLDTVNQAALMLGGPAAPMQPHERILIEPPLQNYAADHADAAKNVGDALGPISCVAGIIFWLKRLQSEGVINAKLPKRTTVQSRGFSGAVTRPNLVPVPPAQPDQPEPPIVRPISDEPPASGYSDLTAAFESITKRG